MTIYIVFYYDWEGAFFHGAFSTREKAQEYIQKQDEDKKKDFDIEEYELE